MLPADRHVIKSSKTSVVMSCHEAGFRYLVYTQKTTVLGVKSIEKSSKKPIPNLIQLSC